MCCDGSSSQPTVRARPHKPVECNVMSSPQVGTSDQLPGNIASTDSFYNSSNGMIVAAIPSWWHPAP